MHLGLNWDSFCLSVCQLFWPLQNFPFSCLFFEFGLAKVIWDSNHHSFCLSVPPSLCNHYLPSLQPKGEWQNLNRFLLVQILTGEWQSQVNLVQVLTGIIWFLRFGFVTSSWVFLGPVTSFCLLFLVRILYSCLRATYFYLLVPKLLTGTCWVGRIAIWYSLNNSGTCWVGKNCHLVLNLWFYLDWNLLTRNHSMAILDCGKSVLG